MAHLIEIGVLSLGALFSAAFVLRWGIWGFFGGVAVFWVFVFVRVELLRVFVPERDEDMLDALTVILGIPIGTVWCLPFLIGRSIYRHARSRRRTDFPT